MPPEVVPWLTNVTTTFQQMDTGRLWTILIAIIVLSATWVLGREILRRLAGRADRVTAREKMSLPTSFQPESRWGTTETERDDLDFARDAEAALHAAPPRTAGLFLLICTTLLATFLIWAYFAQIDEVARGAGRVIPSSKGQIVQSLEGGIVKEILVREGDKVEKGQTLLLMDKTGFASDLGELEAKELALLGAVTRLQTETANPDATGVKFPDELRKKSPSVVQSEEALFSVRRSNLLNQLSVLNDRLTQKRQELAELQEGRKRYQDSLR